MNAMLNIQIRVAANQARKEIQAIERDLNRVNRGGGAGAAAGAATTRGLSGLARQYGITNSAAVGMAGGVDKGWAAIKRFGAGLPGVLSKMEKTGKNMQWVGRQLSFNFTLPLVLAGTAATKWALENEQAMTRVRKVYGDGTYSIGRVKAETDALAKSFEMLSTRFGIHQAEVINIAGDWAQAGAAGRGLAEVVRSTLEAMTLGEIEATEATAGLIAMMAAYHLRATPAAGKATSELGMAIAQLNAIENQTQIDMAGLIGVIQRTGSVAAVSGIKIEELAAMAAGLVPTAGTAAQAGNGLRTMIARLTKPTKETTAYLAKLGLVVSSPAFMGMDVHGRILAIAKAFSGLSDAQKGTTAAAIAGTWQFNKFATLMADINDPLGNYHRALQAVGIETNKAGSRTDVLATKQKELQTILASSPKRFDILKTSIQNSLSKAILPLLPAIQQVLTIINKLAIGFANLDPKTQRFILFALLFVAVVGPIVQMMGATILLTKELGASAFWAGKKIFWLGKQVFSLGQSLLDFFARILFQSTAVTSAWTAGETERVASTAAANAAVTASDLATINGRIAGMVAMNGAFTTAEASLVASRQSIIIAGEAQATAAQIAAINARLGFIGAAEGAVTAETIAGINARLAVIGAGEGAVTAEMIAGINARVGATLAGNTVITASSAEAAAASATAWSVALWPVVAVVVAVAAAVALVFLVLKTDIEKPIIAAVKTVGRAIWMLPRVFGQALTALARVVATVVKTVLHWLSYLNPFARHSPSLVDNVRAGVATILDEYAKLRGIAPIIRDAARAHEAFKQAVAASGNDPAQRERAEQRTIIAEQAPSALPEFDEMGRQVDRLEAELPKLKAEIQAQTAVVAQWEARLKSADAELKQHEEILSDLEAQLDDVSDAMSDAQAELDKLGNTNLPGMRAMSDAIFENEMAQKRLRLEILRMEQAGKSIDDIRDKMAKLNGEIELMRSEKEELRLAGAGSDILGYYDEQISKLEEQKKGLKGQADEIDEMQKKLEDLQRQGEILDLENSINFDPQIRQIDQMIEGLNEMPFDQIIAQIGEQQAKLRELQPQYDAINVLVEAERATVERIQTARDGIADQLDIEQEKLSQLESAYSDIEALIRDMTSDMQAFAAAAKEAAEAADGAALFDAGEGMDFEDVLGSGGLGAEGGLPEIEDFNKDLQAELDKMMEDFGNFEFPDPFGSLKEKFNGMIEFVKTWGGRLVGFVVFSVVNGFFGGLPLIIGAIIGWGPEIWAAVKTVFGAIGNVISDVWHSVIYPVLVAIGGFLSDVLGPVFRTLADIVSWAWREVIAPVISEAWDIIKPIWDALWAFVDGYIIPIIQLVAAVFEIQFRLIWTVVSQAWDIIKVILQALWDFITNVIAPVIMWLWNTIFEPVFRMIGQFISTTWHTVIQPVLQLLWNFITNVIGPVFMWLWNNIVTPVWNAIGSIIGAAWNKVISPIFDGIKAGIEKVGGVFEWLRDHVIRPVWSAITSIVGGAWDRMAGILEGGINFFVKAFNLLARGVNWVAEKVGSSIRIREMDPISLGRSGGGGSGAGSGWTQGYASGTDRIDSYNLGRKGPFMTDGARAIVGEGSKRHPEFVIPTDPKWRGRAQMLYQMLGDKLGGVPRMAAGGGIPGSGLAKGGLNLARDILGGTAGAVKKFWEFANEAISWIKKISVDIIGKGANKIKDMAVDWALDKLESIPIIGPVIGAGRDVVGGAINVGKSAYRNTFGRIGFEAGGMLAADGMIDWGSIPALQNGGVIRHQAGGVLMRVAEGRNDERVQVTPLSGNDGDGETHNHFYGDLSFPNITSGDDAEKFVRNLESLV